MKIIKIISLSLLLSCGVFAQNNQLQKPKLVVGIVVDQMRYDYLKRFDSKFGADGFKRLLKDGYAINNAHFNYIPTYTAVGHTSVYTGTTPFYHGIISNNWYDKELKKSIYCVDDDRYETVGAKTGGKKSPYRMLSTTVTDQLHLAQNMKGKTIGVSIKDRSAILPAGHTANAAYWFEGNTEGKFITSTFYMDKLPKWAADFNNSDKAKKYLNTPWVTKYPINTYTESIADDNPYEGMFKGETSPTFPHNLAKLQKENGGYDILKASPQGNSLVKDFAEATILGENMGKGAFTDFLALSFSSTDYIGHMYGVDSKEIEDTYIRLDQDIADLLNFLDTQVGIANYTVFLTADHAAVPVPAYLKSLKIPADYIDVKGLVGRVTEITKKFFNATDLVENTSNYQIFLDKERIYELGLDVNMVAQTLADELVSFKGIYKTVTAHTMQTTSFNDGILKYLQNGYNQKFSGDVLLVPMPANIAYPHTGTTHGSGYNYDTHVPLIFYGKGIKTGQSNTYYPIIDIAPTMATLLGIEFPNATSGKVIGEVLK
ncbi:MAG: alkaline phosphatase family protein [Flavobacteriales bacterium]|jgi:predicted AlkP superfamily pyrophosphatase or phosphodiesterase|nr:alkaline phosphatase family protein [Flavobacteriales bacterium]